MVKGWEGVNGGVGARRPAAGSEDGRRSGEVQGFILYLIKAGLLPVRFILYLIKAGLLPVRFILYLIKAGLLPVRFRRRIGRAVDRWPEGGAGGVLPGAAVLHHSAGSGWHRSRARERGRPRRFRVREAPE